MMSSDASAAGQRRRLLWLAIVLAVAGLTLTIRTAYWQLVPQGEVLAYGVARGERPNVIPAARGNIIDRSGQYLVSSTVEHRLAVSPRLLSSRQRETLAPQLAAILDMPLVEVSEALERVDSDHVVLAEGLSVWAAEEIEALGADAFTLEPRFRRLYPDDDLAAHVLGFVSLDGQALYGVEQYYERELRGSDGVWRGISDSWGQQILVSLGGYEAAEDGADLVLTLDRNIQYAAERILDETVAETLARSGNIIVLDARTGGILAMAAYPRYSPREYWRVASPDQYINTAVSALYEPGSVFKSLTVAAALEARVIAPDDSYDDRGEIIIGQQRIYNSNLRAHGHTTMTQMLAYSRNVGAAHVAALLGPTRFYEIMRRFGFGEITGVDLANEVPGIMRVPGHRDWSMADLGSNSFGQGLAATPLQVVAAYGALANDGVLLRPHIVAEIHTPETTLKREPIRVRRVISSEAAQQTTAMLADALELGMRQATVPGYRLAGKSGTSGIPDPEGYRRQEVIASFVGYGPLPDPRFVILVTVDRPQTARWGLEVAAPAFARVAEFVLDYYGIPPTE